MPPPFPARRSADLKRPAATPRLCPGAGTCQERRERRIMTAAARRRAYARGRRGERIAAWWLRPKGYRVLPQGFRCPVGEIDLVARRGGIQRGRASCRERVCQYWYVSVGGV